MASGTTAAKPARRQHFIARFYLRNFAEPIFSDNLCVYDMRKQRWEPRTPDGVGWFPHLCSMIDMDGKRTDDFDQRLKLNVEDPAAPALKKMATGDTVDNNERSVIALFIALTAARNPEMMNHVMGDYVASRSPSESAELEELVKLWCGLTGKPYAQNSHSEYHKPGMFDAIWHWSQDLQRRLLKWRWHLLHTTREQPFVTSDRPVLAQWDRDQDVRFVSFPVSSEVALIVIDGGQFNEARDRANVVYAMNRGTMDRATEFVVACKESFPADDYLTTRSVPVRDTRTTLLKAES